MDGHKYRTRPAEESGRAADFPSEAVWLISMEKKNMMFCLQVKAAQKDRGCPGL